MVSISFSDLRYPNHIALSIDITGSSVFSNGFITQAVHSENRSYPIVELAKRHGKDVKTDFG
jgi:hypothetical protein